MKESCERHVFDYNIELIKKCKMIVLKINILSLSFVFIFIVIMR